MDYLNLPLLHQVALITGARGGLGKEVCIAFAKAGADLALCDVVEDKELTELAEQIRNLGRRSLVLKTNVTQKASVDDAVKQTQDEFGRIDILVNNAGIFDGGFLLDLDESQWDKVMNTNVKGYFLFSKAVGKIMVGQKKGNIINMASRNSFKADENKGPYCISKAAVVMFTRVLARELATYNVRVNAIAPGVINLEHTQFMWNDPEYNRTFMNSVPMKRFAEPREIAEIAIFLASEGSSYITGHTILADGGREA